MKVKEAIEQLQKLPPDGDLMVASQGHGCSVPLQGFTDLDDRGWSVDGKAIEPMQAHWIDVIYCEDHEREDYSLPPTVAIVPLETEKAQ